MPGKTEHLQRTRLCTRHCVFVTGERAGRGEVLITMIVEGSAMLPSFFHLNHTHTHTHAHTCVREVRRLSDVEAEGGGVSDNRPLWLFLEQHFLENRILNLVDVEIEKHKTTCPRPPWTQDIPIRWQVCA